MLLNFKIPTATNAYMTKIFIWQCRGSPSDLLTGNTRNAITFCGFITKTNIHGAGRFLDHVSSAWYRQHLQKKSPWKSPIHESIVNNVNVNRDTHKWKDNYLFSTNQLVTSSLFWLKLWKVDSWNSGIEINETEKFQIWHWHVKTC